MLQSARHTSAMVRAAGRLRNSCSLKHSSRKRPLRPRRSRSAACIGRQKVFSRASRSVPRRASPRPGASCAYGSPRRAPSAGAHPRPPCRPSASTTCRTSRRRCRDGGRPQQPAIRPAAPSGSDALRFAEPALLHRPSLIDGLSLQNEGKPAAKGGVAFRDLPGIHARPLRSEVWRGERGRSVGA